MSNSTYFFQECPTCGRHLRIRVEYLGRAVTGVHCRRIFTASDRQMRYDGAQADSSLLERAERLLALAPTKRTLFES
jgi:hypothetical protein